MATFTSSGRDYTIVEVALTGTYADVQVSKACTAFSIRSRAQTKLKWRRSSTDTGEWTIFEGEIYSVDSSLGTQDGATITIGQAKTVDGSADTLELWCWFG